MLKKSESFYFFHLRIRNNLGPHFLFNTFFDNFNFKITLLLYYVQFLATPCYLSVTDIKKHFVMFDILVKMNLVPNVVHSNATTLIWLLSA
jgi:hypothetical protein